MKKRSFPLGCLMLALVLLVAGLIGAGWWLLGSRLTAGQLPGPRHRPRLECRRGPGAAYGVFLPCPVRSAT